LLEIKVNNHSHLSSDKLLGRTVISRIPALSFWPFDFVMPVKNVEMNDKSMPEVSVRQAVHAHTTLSVSSKIRNEIIVFGNVVFPSFTCHPNVLAGLLFMLSASELL